jgi:hypothetical protein
MRLIPIKELSSRLDGLLAEEEFRHAWNDFGYVIPDVAELQELCRALFLLDLCARQGRTLKGLKKVEIHYNRLRRHIEAMNALARLGELAPEWEMTLNEALEAGYAAGLSGDVINRICARQRWHELAEDDYPELFEREEELEVAGEESVQLVPGAPADERL